MGDDPWYLFKRVLQVGTLRHVIGPGERPPYPIIIEEPYMRDVLDNMRLPEFMPLLVAIPVGGLVCYSMTFSMFTYPLYRRQLFGSMYAACLGCAYWMGMKGSYFKLVGFEDNGLKWKFAETRLKKYRFIGELESDSYAMLLKRKDIDGSKQY